MPRYMIIALNGPAPGEGNEDAFNRWYDDVHLPELLAIDGIVGARRFRVVHGNLNYPYAAAYEVDTADLDATLGAMASGMAPFPPEFDRAGSANLIAIDITRDPS